jgi:hypothetical protein
MKEVDFTPALPLALSLRGRVIRGDVTYSRFNPARIKITMPRTKTLQSVTDSNNGEMALELCQQL